MYRVNYTYVRTFIEKKDLNENLKALLEEYVLIVDTDQLHSEELEHVNDLIDNTDHDCEIPKLELKKQTHQNSLVEGIFSRSRNSLTDPKSGRHSRFGEMIEKNYRQCADICTHNESKYNNQSIRTPYVRQSTRKTSTDNHSEDSDSDQLNPDDFKDTSAKEIIEFVNLQKSENRELLRRRNERMHVIIGNLRVDQETLTIEDP